MDKRKRLKQVFKNIFNTDLDHNKLTTKELDIVYINNHNIFFDNFSKILKKLPKHESFNILTTSNDVMKNCINLKYNYFLILHF